MVKLTKESEPKYLSKNKFSFTKRLIESLNTDNGRKRSKNLLKKYNHPEITSALKRESHGKCIYCESKLAHISFPHIEHIKPKSKYPDLTFDYNNMGLSCQVCNHNKSDKYDLNNPIVNPYVDDPNQFFEPNGAFIFTKNDRARWTCDSIGLNRPDLLEARRERIQTLSKLFKILRQSNNDLLKDLIRQEILIEIKKDKEYSFCCQGLLEYLDKG